MTFREIKGALRFPHRGQKSREECKGIRKPDRILDNQAFFKKKLEQKGVSLHFISLNFQMKNSFVIRDPDAKAWPSDPLCLINWGPGLSERAFFTGVRGTSAKKPRKETCKKVPEQATLGIMESWRARVHATLLVGGRYLAVEPQPFAQS